MIFGAQRVGRRGYPSSTEWLNKVLSDNSRVGAYPNYVSSGNVCRRFRYSLASFSRIVTYHVTCEISLNRRQFSASHSHRLALSPSLPSGPAGFAQCRRICFLVQHHYLELPLCSPTIRLMVFGALLTYRNVALLAKCAEQKHPHRVSHKSSIW